MVNMKETAQSPAARVPDGAIEQLEQQLSMLWRRSRSISHRVARDVHPDMEPAAYGLLIILQSEGPMRLTELASNIGVGKPSVSRQVALLESLGLVGKQADPLDGRAQTITLTEKGLSQLLATQLAREQAFRNRLAEWSMQDVESLAVLLAKLNDEYTKDR